MITDRLPKTDCTIFLMQPRGHAAYLLWALRSKPGEAVGFPAALLVLLLVLSLTLPVLVVAVVAAIYVPFKIWLMD